MDTDALLARIDERTTNLVEDVRKFTTEISELRGVAYSAKNQADHLTRDDYAGLRRIIQEEIAAHTQAEGIGRKEWFNIILAIVNTLILVFGLTRAAG